MLTSVCRRRGVTGVTGFLRGTVCSYHTYPQPGEKPLITKHKSTVQKQLDKSSGQWEDELKKLKNKFNVSSRFPGYEESSVDAKTRAAPEPEMTKLDNGLTVVSLDTVEKTMKSFAFLIKSGSSSEVQTNNADNTGGITSILECMAFGPSKPCPSSNFQNTDDVETVSRKLNRIGAIEQAIASRESICYFVDVVQDSAQQGIELLADAVLRPLITKDNLTTAFEGLAFRSDCMPGDVLSKDALPIAAYQGSTLGNFHYPNKNEMLRVGRHTPEKINEFRDNVLYGHNCVLACVGIEHESFVTMAKKFFGGDNLPAASIASVTHPQNSPVPYVGGLYVEQRQLQEPFVKLAVGFEAGGYKSDNLYTMCVVDKLMGGGSSFSAGGPGKGMYTRLYLDVLNHHHWVESAQSFVVPHENNGLLGIDGSCHPQHVQHLYQVILDQFLRLAKEDVTPVELCRAKNMLRSQLMMQLESRLVVCEDIARQYATYGKRESPEHTCALIDKVSAADIGNLVRNMLTQPPSVVCIGEDVSSVPVNDIFRVYTKKKILESLGITCNY